MCACVYAVLCVCLHTLIGVLALVVGPAGFACGVSSQTWGKSCGRAARLGTNSHQEAEAYTCMRLLLQAPAAVPPHLQGEKDTLLRQLAPLHISRDYMYQAAERTSARTVTSGAGAQ